MLTSSYRTRSRARPRDDVSPSSRGRCELVDLSAQRGAWSFPAGPTATWRQRPPKRRRFVVHLDAQRFYGLARHPAFPQLNSQDCVPRRIMPLDSNTRRPPRAGRPPRTGGAPPVGYWLEGSGYEVAMSNMRAPSGCSPTACVVVPGRLLHGGNARRGALRRASRRSKVLWPVARHGPAFPQLNSQDCVPRRIMPLDSKYASAAAAFRAGLEPVALPPVGLARGKRIRSRDEQRHDAHLLAARQPRAVVSGQRRQRAPATMLNNMAGVGVRRSRTANCFPGTRRLRVAIRRVAVAPDRHPV